MQAFNMQKLKKLIDTVLLGYQPGHTGLREKLVSSVTACLSILFLLLIVQYVELELPFKMLVLASMGASAFLLFVTPHSPMAQPWPVIVGHLVSAFIGVACAQWIDNAPLAAAVAVLLSIFAMHLLHCLHPPSAATAMIAVLGGPEVHAIGWQFCYEVVAINAVLMVVLAIALNNLVPGRRYPMLHSHHVHHNQFLQQHQHSELLEEDFKWALSQMDGLIDVSAEDLVDIYEFALERAQSRRDKQALLSAGDDYS
jgi:CBS-domain-containing membrane protein